VSRQHGQQRGPLGNKVGNLVDGGGLVSMLARPTDSVRPKWSGLFATPKENPIYEAWIVFLTLDRQVDVPTPRAGQAR
jgi:hypothetical protein